MARSGLISERMISLARLECALSTDRKSKRRWYARAGALIGWTSTAILKEHEVTIAAELGLFCRVLSAHGTIAELSCIYRELLLCTGWHIRRLSRIFRHGSKPRVVVVRALRFRLKFTFGGCDNLALIAHDGHISIKTNARSFESDLRFLKRPSSSYGRQSAIFRSDLPVGDASFRL